MTMTPTHALLAALLLAPPGALPAPLPAQEPEANASRIPTFAGPTPDTLREITIPTVDLSGDEHRQVVVARGTA